MKVLKAKDFGTYKQLLEFVTKSGIQREAILTITQATGMGYTLFYYDVN
jgi:hypothetical protein